MTTVRLEMPEKLIPLFEGEADVRAADGGRGSGKTRTFAKMTAVKALMWSMAGRSGQILCGRQFMNSLADSSLEEVKAAIRSESWLLPYFEIGDKYVRTIGGKVYYTFTGLDRNVASVKSRARILLCWVDEAEPVTDEAWTTLIPTLREDDSELWVTWNSKRKTAPVEKRFKGVDDARIKYTRVNWRDNPWFPSILERVRQRDMKDRPDQYEHIWEGDFVTVVEGAYFASHLTAARSEGRIGNVSADPLMTTRAVWDIGGTGAKADACAIWIVQFIGKELRFLDYYEAQGQPLASHVSWLRENKYANALCILPHDGATNDKVYDVSYESALRQAGFEVEVVPNQGKGAAGMRIEAARRLFPSMWFNERKVQGGLDAIGWYHEKKDEERNIGLGPDHDWSSHGCLTGDALVSTSRGNVFIRDVVAGDMVYTPDGLAHVDWSGKVKDVEKTVQITLSNGQVLKMTPEHKVFTSRGVVCADAIVYDDAVITERDSACLKLDRAKSLGYRAAFIESFAEKSFGFGQKEKFMSRKLAVAKECSTARLLDLSMVKSFQSMATGKILTLLTGRFETKVKADKYPQSTNGWNSMALAITSNHGTDTIQDDILPWSMFIEQFGRILMEKFQTAIMFITSMVTKVITVLKTCKQCLAANILGYMPWTTLGLAAKKTLDSYDKQERRQKAAELSTSENVLNVALDLKALQKTNKFAARVVDIKQIIEKVAVYDLTVSHHHCYFANGMLVSNSDAFGLACVVYETPKKKKVDDWSKYRHLGVV